ncbi:uncharacterized protein LOC121917940 isoform X2 [Sceloporus undulatus]|uniref:uncharacterized protein LOC121917940 isoform X2 n=1 Tax=Sceloporus undulatus TaxID=8520 RepID=UPI001C4D3DD2|nr:uncharacterized protein LOC121917940 isoform X2 [Sceloporus undulatus]
MRPAPDVGLKSKGHGAETHEDKKSGRGGEGLSKPALAPAFRERVQKPLTCFSCGLEGHLRRDCPMMECSWADTWEAAQAWREREALWAEETEEEGSEPDEDLGAGWEDAGTHQELPVMTPLSSHQQQQGPWMLDRPSTLLTGGSCKEKREEGRVERARGGLQDPGEREDRPGKEEDQLDPRRESETPPWGWEGATGGLIRRKGEAKGGRRFGGRWRRGERDGEGKAEGYSAAEGEKVTREGGGPGTRVRVGPVLATHPACARRREGTQAQPWNLGIGQEGEGARGGEESWWAVRERRRLLGSHASPAPRDEGESSVEDYRPARPSTL